MSRRDHLHSRARRRIREKILQRDGYTCVYCGGDFARDPVMLVLDHVRALRRGGTSAPANLVIACYTCNAVKGARPVEQFLLELIGEAR